jgi:hypothetical protein
MAALSSAPVDIDSKSIVSGLLWNRFVVVMSLTFFSVVCQRCC